jgi:hypothetical protein
MKITKKIIKKTIKAIGIKRINRALKNQGVKYELARKGANHFYYYWHKANKKIDLKELPGFWDMASKIIEAQKTTLYFDRLFTLWQVVNSLPASDFPIAEIGTFRGGSARFILDALKANGRHNPFFVFDTFEGHAVVDQRVDGKHQPGCFSDTSYEEVAKYLDEPNATIYKGNFLETSKNIEHIENFGMVHIDVDVHPVTHFCLEFFKDRTIPGSMLVIDDYGNRNCKGLKMAVDNFISVNEHFKLFYLLTGQALLFKSGISNRPAS